MRKLLITVMITAAIMTLAMAQPAQAAWLSGWDKRVKLTIDSTDIDANLSNFPILVYLSTSSECYVEIEKWDNVAEQAWLWVKVSGTDSISATTDIDLCLYYDNDHADNTTYVGDDPDDAASNNVWDDGRNNYFNLTHALYRYII